MKFLVGSGKLGPNKTSPLRLENQKPQKTINPREIFSIDEGYDADISDEEDLDTSKDVLIGAWILYQLKHLKHSFPITDPQKKQDELT